MLGMPMSSDTLGRQWPPNVRHLDTSIPVQARVGCLDQDCFLEFPSKGFLVFDYNASSLPVYAMGGILDM